MSNEWKAYKVSVDKFELLLSARNKDEAKSIVLTSIRKSELSERLRLNVDNLKLTITRAKGLGA